MKVLNKGLLLFVALFGTLVLVNKVRFYYGWKDAFLRTMLAPFEGTVWAPGFVVGNFEKAHLGMDKAEVSRLLGEPLRKGCTREGECFWVYSWQATGTDDFDQRWVVFDLTGRVAELRKAFYID